MKVNIHTHHPKNDERTLSVVGIHPYDSEGATTDSVFAVERLCTTGKIKTKISSGSATAYFFYFARSSIELKRSRIS